jgi:hypothetical protein
MHQNPLSGFPGSNKLVPHRSVFYFPYAMCAIAPFCYSFCKLGIGLNSFSGTEMITATHPWQNFLAVWFYFLWSCLCFDLLLCVTTQQCVVCTIVWCEPYVGSMHISSLRPFRAAIRIAM